MAANPAKVVDASAVAALLFGEPEADSVAEQLAGARLLAPTLLAFELADVCRVKCRRHPEQKDALIAAFRLRGGLGIESLGVDHDSALELAALTGLTAYDSSYLWLARQREAGLVTLDQPVLKAAATVL